MGRSSTTGYWVSSSLSTDCCQCSHLKRMLASLLFALLLFRPTVFAASPSSSFGISAPVPLLEETLNLLANASWIRSTGRNVSERSSLIPQNTQATNNVGPASTKPTSNYQSVDLCDHLNLTPRQKQMCVQGGEGLAETLLEAIRMSVYTCQQQFEYERWNCSLQGDSRMSTLKKAYKETAALYAFSAAGIAHAVARACARATLRNCHCAEAENEIETRQTWRWGGCGDNLAYGRAFATKFLDAGPSPSKVRHQNSGGKSRARPDVNADSKQSHNQNAHDIHAEMEAVSQVLRRWRRAVSTNTALALSGRIRKSPSSEIGGSNFVTNGPHPKKNDKVGGKKIKNESQRQRINRHNNAVGRQVVEQLVNRTCKCHGVSGSCSVKTCWHQLAAFSDTAAVIKRKYDNAVQVNGEIRENSSHLRTGTSLSSKNQESNRIVPQSRAKKATDQIESATIRKSGTSSADRVNRKELIYQQRSPDFCVANPLGPGTTGRLCQRGENCEILCCGRGYNVHRLTVTMSCKCKLILCCRVECQNCLVEKTIHTCK